MDRPETRRSFTKPVDQSASRMAIMERRAIMRGRQIGGRQKNTTKISGMHTTATRIRFPMVSDASKPAGAALIGRQGPVELFLGKSGQSTSVK